jgi:hypothetical protein
MLEKFFQSKPSRDKALEGYKNLSQGKLAH